MPQNEVIRATGRVWDFLEPAMYPETARTDHGVLLEAAPGQLIHYAKGQIVRQATNGTNKWAKAGTAGYAGAPRILKYSYLVDEDGFYQMSDSGQWVPNGAKSEGSVDFYLQGFFKTQDLVGSGGAGTNEVQTETIDSDIDGGTRALSWMGYKTAPIAYNANAATIKAALLAAIPILTTSDITVAGAGPYTYTFEGAYASTNVPMIVPDYSLLTDGGLTVVHDSAIVQTTPGVGNFTGVGRLVRGTAAAGILELGTGAPA